MIRAVLLGAVPRARVSQTRTAAEQWPAPQIRVAHAGPVTPEWGGATPGGVATHLVHLAEGLRDAGVAVSLLATNAAAPSVRAWMDHRGGVDLYRMYQPAGLEWVSPDYLAAVGIATLPRYALGLRSAPARPLGSRRVALAHLAWYRRFLIASRPRLLHVQHPMERHLYARLLRHLEGWRLPLVVTLHSFSAEHPEHVVQGLMRPNLPHADVLIAVSRGTAREAVSLGADPGKLRVIRSGVDAQTFRPRDREAARLRLGVRPDLPLALFVGNLEPRKAVNLLLMAMARVRQSVPDAALAIVGTGQSAGAEDQEPRLRAMARELELTEAARFLGRVSSGELADWYAAADAFVLPSSSEAQGIAALEAMASGLPVVASAVGGLLDTIQDGHTGYLVPFGDVHRLAAHVADLLTAPPLRLRLGSAARAAVEREFSWQRSVAQTIEVYREVLESCRA